MTKTNLLQPCLTGCNLLAALLSIAAGVASAQSSGTPAAMTERDHLRDTRYCEILVVHRQAYSASAAVYNTLGLNDCPEARWKALNLEKLKAENSAYAVIMNGPRYFVMDRNALRSPGPVHDFDGLQARWLAQIDIPAASRKRKPYTETAVERESQYVYERGKNIYELISPAGTAYIMQSYSVEVDAGLNEAALASLSSRLSLPAGWRYVVRDLKEDLTVRNSGSKAYVLQDDLKNTYQRLE